MTRDPRHMSEDDLLRAVVDLARHTNWLVYHPRPCRRLDGSWMTALQGDPGFVDLVLTNGSRLLLVELKSDVGRVSDAQERWHRMLSGVPGLEVYIWRPADWPDTIAPLLLGSR